MIQQPSQNDLLVGHGRRGLRVADWAIWLVLLCLLGFGGLLSGGDDAGGHVGDERDAEDIQTHVAGDDDLVDGRHADEVCAKAAMAKVQDRIK